jgi:periplasmic protein TonB
MASAKTWFVSGSLLAHGIFAVAIGEIEVKKASAATAIEIAEVAKKKAPPPPEPSKVDPEPLKPREARAQRARAAAAPPPEAPPPPANAAAPIDTLPDFGLSLTGGAEGSGFAMAAGHGGPTAPRPAATAAQPKRLAASLPSASSDGCSEDAIKPKPRAVPQPTYTDAARTAQVQGKVRVQLTVDETGRVVDVKLLQGLGYGLDEAALSAARQASFEPAQRCGKPTRATFNISMRFTL